MRTYDEKISNHTSQKSKNHIKPYLPAAFIYIKRKHRKNHDQPVNNILDLYSPVYVGNNQSEKPEDIIAKRYNRTHNNEFYKKLSLGV